MNIIFQKVLFGISHIRKKYPSFLFIHSQLKKTFFSSKITMSAIHATSTCWKGTFKFEYINISSGTEQTNNTPSCLAHASLPYVIRDRFQGQGLTILGGSTPINTANKSFTKRWLKNLFSCIQLNNISFNRQVQSVENNTTSNNLHIDYGPSKVNTGHSHSYYISLL